jgi:hypothetical protein
MPNSDYSPFKFSEVSNEGSLPTDLYTHKRVNQFVTDYKNFKETEVKGTASDPEVYAFYHFVASPGAIASTNLGALASSLCLIDNSTNCLLQPYSSTVTGAPQLNTPDGHKMNLLKEYETFLLSVSKLIAPFVPTTATMDISDNAMENVQPGNVMAFDGYIDKFATSSKVGTTKSYAVEVFAYIEFPAMGDYKFSFEVDKDALLSTFFAWIGDLAPCEYMVQNATMNINKRKDVLVSVTDARKVPLRLQYYCTPSPQQPSAARKSQQDILKMLTCVRNAGAAVPLNLYSSTSPFVFVYPPLYAAFTSQTQNSYMAGQFRCYTNFDWLKAGDGLHARQFYDVIQKNKRDVVLRGLHNRDQDGIKQVGKLPSLQVTDSTPIYFTENTTTNVLQLPNVFSLYRFSIDIRYDNTYQISTQMPHTMIQVADDLLTFSNSYTDFPGYLPLNPTHTTSVSVDKCKEKCNESPSQCGYYYAYTTNNGSKPQCVLDTTGQPPIFNQLRTGDSSSEMDVGSGTLAVRNKMLKDAPKLKCASQTIEPTVLNTDDYTRNFKYANYDLSSGVIRDSSELGTCGSKKYKDFVERAKDILYSTHEYRDDGLWKNQESAWISKEGLQSKNSTAVNDTTDSIKTNLENHEQLRRRLTGISRRDEDLEHTVKAYHGISSYMNSNERYDQNGNMLLYLRSEPPPPSLAQLNASDSQFLTNQQTLLFYTGIITAASLIVLAVTMGSE